MEKIAVIGLGYVGLPTLLVLSNLKKGNSYRYSLVGIEKDNYLGNLKINSLQSKLKLIKSSEKKFNSLYKNALSRKEVIFTNDYNKLKSCKKIIVSINFEISSEKAKKNLLKLFTKIAENISKNSLIVLQSTLPPGMSEKIILPRIKKDLSKRKLKLNDIYFAYSYERVTPGDNYIDSIISSPRCYSAINRKSKRKCKEFLMKILKKKELLTEFNSITECETAKVLENSFRAINISFIDEWTKISQKLNVNLFDIINAIRKRPTHKNLMFPGLGVGGYCLTKDPTFIKYTSKNILGVHQNFPITSQAVKINKNMIYTSLKFVMSKIKIKKKKILVCGGSYKEDTNDTRHSPSLKFAKILQNKGGKVYLHDPWLNQNKIASSGINFEKKFSNKFDIIIFAVSHKIFKKINVKNIKKNCTLFDLNNCLSSSQFKQLKNKKNFYCLGKV